MPVVRLDRSASPGELAEPLSTAARRGILALVIFFHVGGGWALTQVEPVKLVVGDIAPMEVRMVPAAEPAQPEIEDSEPPPPVELKPPPPKLATIVEPPPPDLPPPEFPLAKVELPPPDEPPPPEFKPPEKVEPKPKPPEPKPVQRKPQPARPAAPVEAGPQQAAPAAPAAPRTVQASQLGWLVQPNPAYPARARRAGDQGTATIRVLVDVTGRPAQVSLVSSSGHADLDQAALSAVRAAQFRPYVEGGLAQAVLVHVPIKFVLQ
ncbi:energy transducer TonB [Reyranella sp.]|uniref:energy transducer TonB n=1 Tax=Reyranella sp. TaxID=1929291 RepID=UPI003D0A7005